MQSGGREISFLAAVEVVVVKEAGEVVIEVDLAAEEGGATAKAESTISNYTMLQPPRIRCSNFFCGYGAESLLELVY